MKKLLLATIISASLGMSGCVGLAVGSALIAGGAVAATIYDRRTPGMVIDDRSLEIAIATKLLMDPIVNAASHTNLTIYNGVVLITGEAKTREVAKRVIAIARSAPNSKRIESDLYIGPVSTLLNRGNDAITTTKVKTSLLSLNLPNFDPTLVNVSTERGNVYLMGLVTNQEANAIAQLATRTAGVVAVIKMFEYIDAPPIR